MDTEIFNIEISSTNVTKAFIEYSSSGIHRNMIRKLRSLSSKSVYSVILAMTLIAVFSAQQLAHAGRSAFDQGYADGREARLNGGSSQAYCDPNNDASNPDAFCASYKAGYWAGWNAAGILYGDQ